MIEQIFANQQLPIEKLETFLEDKTHIIHELSHPESIEIIKKYIMSELLRLNVLLERNIRSSQPV
jgi:hypothetical protein